MTPSRRERPSSSLVEYGVIGDCHTAALVSRHGSIDWLCWPRLDSPSVFGALLDAGKGGHMAIRPIGHYTSEHSYEGDSNVLHTTFTTETGSARIIDFMPIEEIDRDDYNFGEIHRILEVTRGTVKGDAEFQPAFDYGRAHTNLSQTRNGVLATGAGQRLVLAGDVPFEIDQNTAYGGWELRAGERARFVLRFDTRFPRPVEAYGTDEKLEMTRGYWHRWIGRCTYRGRYADKVRRSALTLKLLTYSPTGAFAAAATTSLPESPGGVRNWDYRYTWLRDSAFALEAIHGVGYSDLARRYLRWMRRLLRGYTHDVHDLRVCYGLEGETQLGEPRRLARLPRLPTRPDRQRRRTADPERHLRSHRQRALHRLPTTRRLPRRGLAHHSRPRRTRRQGLGTPRPRHLGDPRREAPLHP